MNKNLVFAAIILTLSAAVFITMNLLDSFESNLDKEAIEKANNSISILERENTIIVEKTNENPNSVTNLQEDSPAESIDKNEDRSINTDNARENSAENTWSSTEVGNNFGENQSITVEENNNNNEQIVEENK